MALIKCHECRHEVSSEAGTCPKCGVAVDVKKAKGAATASNKFIALLAMIAIFGVIISTNQHKEAAAEAKANQTPEQKVTSAKRDAQLQWAAIGAVQLKDAMKDPTAFELTSLYVTKNGYGCYEYRAKNSFGAILPSSAVLTPKGKLLAQERQGAEFAKTWNRECTQPGGDEISSLVNRRIF